jgi:hypothetical protein
MAKKEKEKHLNARQIAYEKKQEQEGRNVVTWIIAVLILLAIGYALFTILMTS